MSDTPLNRDGPIGVFDSGIGGVSVLREIRAQLPAEDLLYVADSAHAPYGDKSPSFIRERAEAITGFLVAQGAKAIVVACNTATAAAIMSLRARYSLPIVGMEPAVKPAVAATKTGVVGILATQGTLTSARFAALLGRFGSGTTVITQPCPGLVEQIEAGELSSLKTLRLVRRYTQPMLKRGADTLILGCTHYPFIRLLVEGFAGPGVSIIDTGPAVARHLAQRLHQSRLTSRAEGAGNEQFYTSADPQQTRSVLRLLWHPQAQWLALPEEIRLHRPPAPSADRAD